MINKDKADKAIVEYFKSREDEKVDSWDLCDISHDIRNVLKDLEAWNYPDEPPKTDEYVLLSFENFSLPCIGRYSEDENGGNYYCGDEDETLLSQGLIVNGWMPLPALCNIGMRSSAE